jgi:hypothetical protein
MNVSASPLSGESMSNGPASSTRLVQATLDGEDAIFFFFCKKENF